MLTMLYNLLVMPIELIVEMTYCIMKDLLENEGMAIIAVSLVIQTLVLPIYKRSDTMQEQEREKQEQMSYWVNHIKRTFKGDERFMMLQTYYRQQNYKTWYALKSSISILLQIPFFLAGYNFLSNLGELSGKEFMFIKDLGAQDQMINLFGTSINLLPILMTIINIVSSLIYTRGFPLKNKIQTYALALFFLIVLYKSPSGLVLYWTMNNVYSLLKNVIMKLIKLPQKKRAKKSAMSIYMENMKTDNGAFYWEMALLALLMGALIPLSVISSSATEFVSFGSGPYRIIIQNICIYVGVFLVWGSVFFLLMTKNAKRISSMLMLVICATASINYMFFGKKLGTMSTYLVYDKNPIYFQREITKNIIVLMVVTFVMLVLYIRLTRLVKPILQIVFLSMGFMCIMNVVSINSQMKIYKQNSVSMVSSDEKIIPLSKNGKNVIVFMLDRAISGYIPYIFEEKSEVKEAFSDFTYFPNTLSYGQCTNFGAPPLFGGYEYTPVNMNAREKESLKDKHDEALLLMPRIFSDNGYRVTVCDPPYAGYNWNHDLSIYDEYENIRAYTTEGAYVDQASGIKGLAFEKMQKSNFVYFSLMRVMPVTIRNDIYNSGKYFTTSENTVSTTFLDCYTTMLNLSNITEIKDDNENTFLSIQNSLTHEPALLSVPSYTPEEGLEFESISKMYSNKTIGLHTMKLETRNQVLHYQPNVAALMAMTNWINFLKENGVYDNTRIIIVADHGREVDEQFDYMSLSNGLDVEAYNPLLMVKDFNARGFKQVDDFMTNADVPTLAFDGLIEKPINPFTGKEVNSLAKFEGLQIITTSENWKLSNNNGNVFDTSDGEWYGVKDNIFDVNNWVKIDQ